MSRITHSSHVTTARGTFPVALSQINNHSSHSSLQLRSLYALQVQVCVRLIRYARGFAFVNVAGGAHA